MRQSELNVSLLKGDFDFNCLKAIHHYLFSGQVKQEPLQFLVTKALMMTILN